MKIEMLIVSEIKKENSEHWERKTKKKRIKIHFFLRK